MKRIVLNPFIIFVYTFYLFIYLFIYLLLSEFEYICFQIKLDPVVFSVYTLESPLKPLKPCARVSGIARGQTLWQ